MKTKYILGILLFVISNNIMAQEYYSDSKLNNLDKSKSIDTSEFVKKGKTYIGLNYNVGMPMSNDLNNFISNNSFSGMSVEFLYFLNSSISIGASVSYQYFTERVEGVVSEGDDGFIKGTQFRNLFIVPVLAEVNYYFASSNNFSAYVGTGIGVAFTNNNTEVSRYLYQDKSTNFMIKPELGAMYRIYDNIFMNMGVNYNYINGSDTQVNLGYIGASVGIVIR